MLAEIIKHSHTSFEIIRPFESRDFAQPDMQNGPYCLEKLYRSLQQGFIFCDFY